MTSKMSRQSQESSFATSLNALSAREMHEPENLHLKRR